MNKFQAIILAGGVNSGSFLYPLCVNYPKALLPVCNRPMIAYSLDLIDQIGITDIIVVATENNASVSNAFGKFKNKIDFVIVNDDSESGSAILQIADKIKKDFIIISCDTITDINLLDVIDFHASQQSILTMVCKEEDLESKLGKAPVSCNLDDTYDIMLLSNNRLVHIVNVDENPEEIIVKKNILMKFDEVQVMPNLFDSHIYVCKQQLISIMQQLAKQATLSSFKDDVIPLLAKNQCNLELLKLFQYKQDFFQRKQTEFNINVYFTNNYVRRLNNLKDYKQANFDSLVKGDKAIKAFYHSHQIENIQPQGVQAKISPDSVFGEDCHIGEKVTIQRSIIGKHCKIGNNVKISNSIIFREGVIHSGSIIQNCILANNTYIEQNCILDKCETGAQTQIEQGTKKVEESIV